MYTHAPGSHHALGIGPLYIPFHLQSLLKWLAANYWGPTSVNNTVYHLSSLFHNLPLCYLHCIAASCSYTSAQMQDDLEHLQLALVVFFQYQLAHWCAQTHILVRIAICIACLCECVYTCMCVHVYIHTNKNRCTCNIIYWCALQFALRACVSACIHACVCIYTYKQKPLYLIWTVYIDR